MVFQLWREGPGGHCRIAIFTGSRARVDSPGRARRAELDATRPALHGKNFRMLLALGLGFSARALARRALARGLRVAGTVRGQDVARESAIACVRFDAAAPLAPVHALLAATTHVLVSIPPDDAAMPDPTLRHLGPAIASARNIVWLGYLSSTGVYGDRAGAEVDETSERRPGNARSVRRAAAEDAWLALWRDRGVPVHVFRLSGIYGPGRSAIDQLRAGTAKRIDKPGQVFSRIHVDDIAGVLEASIARPRPGAIYNVADDGPAPAAAVVKHAARLLGLPPPPLEPYDPARLSPMAREFYAESRRISNRRIKSELGYALRHPDYESGLAAILAG
jgi:nucleoside-diphosphate-sugar epimerase